MEQFLFENPFDPKICKFMITHDTQCARKHRNTKYQLCYVHLDECKRIYPKPTPVARPIPAVVPVPVPDPDSPDEIELSKRWICPNPSQYHLLTYRELFEKHWGFVGWVARKTINDKKAENKFPTQYDTAFIELTELAMRWNKDTNSLDAKKT